MRKVSIIVVFALFCASIALAEVVNGKIDLKVGDEVYACNCGEECPCMTMSRKPGNCSCDNEMVKAEVVKIEEDTAMLKAESWETARPFKMTGKYVCACGPECKCDTVSQNPGKCSCGVELKKVQ